MKDFANVFMILAVLFMAGTAYLSFSLSAWGMAIVAGSLSVLITALLIKGINNEFTPGSEDQL